jgi:flagellar motor switch protein FliG
MNPELSETILTKLEEENQTVAASLRDLMFVFDDLASIDKEGMKALLAKVDRKALTTALKGTTGKIREHFTQCMSQRAAEMLTEDMEALGAVRIRDVEAAQQQVVAVVRELQKQGTISAGRGGNDEYVV